MYNLYPEIKFWCSAGTALIMLYKCYQWVKTIKTSDLVNINNAVTSLETSTKDQTITLKTEMQEQTKSFVDELKELRADVRGFTNAFIVPPRRAKTKPKIKPKAKPRAKPKRK